GPRSNRPRADDPRGSLLPDTRESANRGERRAVHIERVFDPGEGPLTVARHAHVDESIQRQVVREADENRIRADLPAVRHVAVMNLQEHIPEDRALRDHPSQHLVVDQGPHGLLELPEFAIQSRGLELPTHRSASVRTSGWCPAWRRLRGPALPAWPRPDARTSSPDPLCPYARPSGSGPPLEFLPAARESRVH